MKTTLTRAIARFLRDESGSSAVEYGLIAGFIACIVISALRGLGTRMSNKFGAISNGLS